MADRLKRLFPQVPSETIDHVFLTVCGRNFDIAQETLSNLSPAQLRDLSRAIGVSEDKEPKGPSLTPQQQETVGNFRAITGVSEPVALQFLQRAGWSLEGAMNQFFESGQSFDVDFSTVPTDGPEDEARPGEKKQIPMDSPGVYDKTNQARARLHRVSASLNVSDYLQTLSLSRTYINGTETPVEMVCVFAAGSNVHRVTIEFYDPVTEVKSRVVAKAVAKQRARETYDDAIADGNVAGLLEQKEVSSRLVTLQLGNVGPGWHVTVVSESVGEVTMGMEDSSSGVSSIDDDLFGDTEEEEEEEEEEVGEDSTTGDDGVGVRDKMWLECVIPAVFNIDDETDEMDVSQNGTEVRNTSLWFGIRITQGRIISDEIISTSHPDVRLQSSVIQLGDSNSLVTVRPSLDFVALSHDFILRVPVLNFPVATCLVQPLPTASPTDTMTHVAMVSVVPRNGIFDQSEMEQRRRLRELSVMSELILIVDCSGSMAGSRIQHARDAGKLFLQSLDANDMIRLNIVRFGSTFEMLYRNGPQVLTSQTFEEAMRYMDNTQSNLAQTDILSPLRAVLQTPCAPHYSRQVFLLTDGEDSQSLRIVKMAREYCSATRVFTLGIGGEINHFLIRELATATNAKSTFLTASADIRPKVMEQLNYAVQPSVRNLGIGFDLSIFGATQRVLSRASPYVYANQRLVEYFYVEKYDEDQESDAPVTVSYTAGGSGGGSGIAFREIIAPIGLPEMEDPEDVGISAASTIPIPILAASRKIEELQLFGTDKARDKAEIERLALQFNLLSSETSFVCVSDSPEVEIHDELRVEKVAAVPYAGRGPEEVQRPEQPTRATFGGGSRLRRHRMLFAAAPEPEPERYRAPPRANRAAYYVGGRATGVDWGAHGMMEEMMDDAMDMDTDSEDEADEAMVMGVMNEVLAMADSDGSDDDDFDDPMAMTTVSSVEKDSDSKDKMKGGAARNKRKKRRRSSGRRRQEAEEESRSIAVGFMDHFSAPQEQGRAMMKSLQESTGTVLSTDWTEVPRSTSSSSSASQAFSGSHGEDWMASGTTSTTEAFSGTHGDDWGENSSSPAEPEAVESTEDTSVINPFMVSEVARRSPARDRPRPAPASSRGRAAARGRGRGRGRGPGHARGGGFRGRGMAPPAPSGLAAPPPPPGWASSPPMAPPGGGGRFGSAAPAPGYAPMGGMGGFGARPMAGKKLAAQPPAPPTRSAEQKFQSLDGSVLDKILYMQTMEGLWPAVRPFIQECVGVDPEAMLQENPLEDWEEDEEKQSLWLTAVILMLLRVRFGDESVQWTLIARKATKALKRCEDFRAVAAKAKDYVESL